MDTLLYNFLCSEMKSYSIKKLQTTESRKMRRELEITSLGFRIDEGKKGTDVWLFPDCSNSDNYTVVVVPRRDENY